MNILNLVASMYKQELADANEQKVLFKAQCEIYKEEIAQLKKQLQEANEKVAELKAKDEVEQVEAEVIQ